MMLATFIDKGGHECTVKLESDYVYHEGIEPTIITHAWFGDLYLGSFKNRDINEVMESVQSRIEYFDIRNEGVEHE